MKYNHPEIEIKFIDGGRLYQAHDADAGYDLTCVGIIDETDQRGQIYHRIRTGVCLELPCGIQAEVRPRSSAVRNGYIIHHGTIDPGYIGEICVLLYPGSAIPAIGERFAQLIFSPVYYPKFVLVDLLESIARIARGENGFGSSGKR